MLVMGPQEWTWSSIGDPEQVTLLLCPIREYGKVDNNPCKILEHDGGCTAVRSFKSVYTSPQQLTVHGTYLNKLASMSTKYGTF